MPRCKHSLANENDRDRRAALAAQKEAKCGIPSVEALEPVTMIVPIFSW